jgi:hypothetical protein
MTAMVEKFKVPASRVKMESFSQRDDLILPTELLIYTLIITKGSEEFELLQI